MPTPTDKIGTDELLEKEQTDNERFQELRGKDELTPEEQDEMKGLRERHGQRAQKRIDKLSWEAKSAKEEAAKEKERAATLEARIAELERPGAKSEPIGGEEIEIGGKKFLTDAALQRKVAANQMTEGDAYNHQRQRDKAEVKAELKSEFEEKETQRELERARKDSVDWVQEHYPQFDNKHPDHDPNDPVYLKANQLFSKGLRFSPTGLKDAILEAEEFAGKKGKRNERIDRSDDFSFDKPAGKGREPGGKDKDLELTAEEKEFAERTWCQKENPKTQKPFSKQEAQLKYLEAKKGRKAQYEE
jgi:hypothetical protein